MPLYDYRCRSCGHEFEIQQSITDDALSTCPECGGELRKVFSPVGISFKGSGFYKNDARSSSKGSSGSRAGGTASTGSTGDSGGSSSVSSDTKAPAASTSAPSSGE